MQPDPLRRLQGATGAADDSAGTPLDDTAFRPLSDARRRVAIRCLASASGSVRLSDLADAVAAHEAADR